MAEDPRHSPYRLAYARALVRENRAREALALYDSLVTRDPSDALLREAAGVYSSAGDARGASRLLMRALLRTPADTALRREYARVLSWGQEHRRALVEYDRLIADRPRDHSLLLERARVFVALNDLDRARRDVDASLALDESAEALALRGDLFRWRGEWELARADYRRALELDGGNPAFLTALAQIDRDERASLAPVWDDAGTTATFTYAEDNAGYLYLAAGGRYAFPYENMLASVGVEQRRVAYRPFGAEERYVYGWVADVGLSTLFGKIYVGGRAGVARHALVPTMMVGEARVAAPVGRAYVAAGVRTGPAYETLRTSTALVRTVGADAFATPALSLDALNVSVSIPFEDVVLGASAEHVRLSDGNDRTGFHLDARWALAEELYAVYSGGVLGFDGRSELYWDPEHYSSHSLGLEYRTDTRRPLTLAARVLPGIARTRETPAVADSSLRFPARLVPQLAAGGEIAWRSSTWLVALSGAYGRGREGGYQSLSGGARVRVEW
jgi:Flp pilus assembly protein TadD